MGGEPNWFQVTQLECIASTDPPGSEMKDVIVVKDPAAVGPGDAFSLVVTFEGNPNKPIAGGYWLYLAEAASDLLPAIPVTADFWAESIGPGVEVLIGSATVDLTDGGNPGGHPMANASLYQARLDVADANTIFWDPVGAAVQPGLYRIGCAVHTIATLFAIDHFADAYYQQDLLVRVVERT